MAKKAKAAAPRGEETHQAAAAIIITYNLLDLPTAQHRAGLAGLLLQIESMRSRGLAPPTWEPDLAAPDTGARVTFTETSTAALFDDLYDATWIEGPPREKPFTKGKGDRKKEVPPVRRQTFTKTDKNNKEKTIEGYVYLELTPALTTLRQYLPQQGEWLRLWRDLIWQVVRDSKKKAPYIQRAAAKLQPAGATAEEVAETVGEAVAAAEEDEQAKGDGSTWSDLVKYDAARRKNTFAVGALSSALLLGAQSANAESVSFKGRIDQNLLLHFWTLTAMVFVPRFVDADGQSHIGRRNKDDSARHFCLAIPDVAHLPDFLRDYPQLLHALKPDMALHRPREAVIDLPAEGGLSFVDHLARLVPQTAGGAETRGSVAGIDYLHLCQEGNIVRSLSSGRIAYNRYLAEDYCQLTERYANPLFRRGLMLAMLDESLTQDQWFRPFAKMFADGRATLFIPSIAQQDATNDALAKVELGKEPRQQNRQPKFWTDARRKIQEFIMSADLLPQANGLSNERLVMFVERIVKRFLIAKAKKRENIDATTKMTSLEPNQKKKVYDQARKIALDAFYRARALHQKEFVAFFTEEICSFGSHFDRKLNEFSAFAEALIDPAKMEDIKTLTLLALSANA